MKKKNLGSHDWGSSLNWQWAVTSEHSPLGRRAALAAMSKTRKNTELPCERITPLSHFWVISSVAEASFQEFEHRGKEINLTFAWLCQVKIAKIKRRQGDPSTGHLLMLSAISSSHNLKPLNVTCVWVVTSPYNESFKNWSQQETWAPRQPTFIFPNAGRELSRCTQPVIHWRCWLWLRCLLLLGEIFMRF